MLLQTLKEENGLTIIKLSEKKVMFKHKIPICLSTGEVVCEISAKIRYNINSPSIIDNYLYTPLGTKQKSIGGISNRLGVKMKDIDAMYVVEEHFGKKFQSLSRYVITNKVWERDFKLKKILENEVNSNK